MAKRKGTSKSQTATETKASTEEQQATETQQEETKVEETQESTQTESTSTETQPSGDDSASKDESETQPSGDSGDTKEEPVVEDKSEPKLAVSQDDRVAFVQKSLDDYIQNMGPNVPVTEDDIRSNQIRLKNTINSILSADDAIFDEVFTEAVKRIRADRKGAFRDVLVYRGFATMRIRQEERKRFEMLLQLMLACADSKNIKSIGDKVDLGVVLRYVKNDEQANRLQSFFG